MPVIVMLFEKKQEQNEINYETMKQLEYKSKFGFLDELKNSVRTDEEYAKFKGYID